MKKITKINYLLGFFAVIQFVLFGLLFVDKKSSEDSFGSHKLIEFDMNSIDKISISSSNSDSIDLVLDDNWLIENDSSPVIGVKVQKLLTFLNSIKVNAPVSSSLEFKERFGLSDRTFTNMITLYSGRSSVVSFVVGNSSKFKHFFVKMLDSDDIYSIKINLELTRFFDKDYWFDKNIFSVSGVSEINTGSISFKKDLGDWKLIEGDGGDLDGRLISSFGLSKVNKVVDLLSMFKVNSIIPLPDLTDISSFDIKVLGNKKADFKFFKFKDSFYILNEIFDSEHAFNISESVFNNFYEFSALSASNFSSDEVEKN